MERAKAETRSWEPSDKGDLENVLNSDALCKAVSYYLHIQNVTVLDALSRVNLENIEERNRLAQLVNANKGLVCFLSFLEDLVNGQRYVERATGGDGDGDADC